MINVNSAASRRNSAISKNQHVSYTAERGELGSPRAHVGAAARTWGVLMLGLGSMLAVHGVLAAAEADSPAQSATRSSAAPDGLEEIVVTAQKRTEELIKSPLAISALTQGQLQDSGVESLKDLTSTVPNVQLRTQSIFQSVGITIRGISNFIANEYGDPAVATYIDGIYVGRTQGLSGDLYDLARVEVLRGPQGTLNGRNATGGNINVITADPKDSFGAAADVSYGNYGDVQTHAMVNMPLTNTLVVRAAMVTHQSRGYFNTEGTTARNYGAADDYGGRLTVLWTPGDTFQWRLSVDDFVSNGTPGLNIDTAPNGQPSDGRPVFERPVNNSPEPLNSIHNFMVRSRMTWQITGDLSLAYLAGYQHLWLTTQGDFDAIAARILDGLKSDGSNDDSQEIDLNYESDLVKNVLGANYFHMNNYEDDVYHLWNAGVAFGSYSNPIGDHAWGIFDQATYSVAKDFRITGGLRYSKEDRSQFRTFTFCGLAASLSQLNAVYSGGPLPAGCSPLTEDGNDGKETFSNVSWKVGLEHDLSEQTLSYLSVSTGFKAGGANVDNSATPQPVRTFKPETVTNYELGLKSLFLDGRASLSSAIFYESYRNEQVNQITANASTVTDNAGKSKIYGLEVEGAWRVGANDHISGFLSYLHATYTDYKNAVNSQTGTVYPSLNGNYLATAPRFSARLQYSHDFSLKNGGTLTPMAIIYGQSSNYLTEFNLPIDYVGGYAKTNLNVTYADPSRHWKLAAYVDNAGNKIVRDGAFAAVGHYYSDYDPPRTFGVRASYSY